MTSDHDSDDEVGYRKPPVQHQFKKGESGNPNGRPKGRGNLVHVFKQIASKKVRVRSAEGICRMTVAEAVLSKYWQLAINGKQTALYSILPLIDEAEHIIATRPKPGSDLFTPEGDLVDWVKPIVERVQAIKAKRNELRAELRRRRRLRAEMQQSEARSLRVTKKPSRRKR
jgi:Family of unknown function (DUF5681)